MLSLASILNPERPEPRGTRLPSSAPSSLRASSSTYGSPQLSSQSSSTKKQKMTKDGAIFAKGKIKGDVNYPPFERLSQGILREVENFQVYPLGKIQDYCRHIPYNSEKKSFLEKTGRESFEVFQYTFKVPGDEKEYCVMWDYNIGLVRITPFFKCCKYSKTTPAKMLNSNPGLKEITHSITGGALAAQGYWMPYECAREICMTFCSHIAPALIPIFGPDFPSQCVSPEAPEHGRHTIGQNVIQEATAQAEAFRVRYSSNPSSSKSSSRESYSPQHPIRHVPHMHSGQHKKENYSAQTQTLDRRARLKRAFGGDSPYETTTDTDAGETSSSESGYFHSSSPINTSTSTNLASCPRTWGHAHPNHNMQSHTSNAAAITHPQPLYKGPNPLLSAIPRSTGVVDMQMALSSSSSTNNLGLGHRWPPLPPQQHPQNHAPIRIAPINIHPHPAPYPVSHSHSHSKRPRISPSTPNLEDANSDRDYDGGEDTSTDDKMSIGSPSKTSDMDVDENENVSMSGAGSPITGRGGERGDGAGSVDGSTGSGSGSGGAEKKAAYLLMNLSMKDGESVGAAAASNSGNGSGVVYNETRDGDGLGFGFGARRGVGLGLGLVFKGDGDAGRGLGSATAVGSPAGEERPRIKRLRAASA